MDWTAKEMENQDDRFGSLPFVYILATIKKAVEVLEDKEIFDLQGQDW